MAPQLGLEVPKKFAYFGLYTPVALTSQCLLEMSGADYEGVVVDFAKWGEIKPTTPTGVLPYAEMADGTVIAESGAIGRTIAGAAGFLGSGADFMKSEMLSGMTGDLNKKVMEMSPTVMTIANFDDAKQAAFNEKKAGVPEFIEKYKQFLTPAGDRFTESGTTFGEIDLFCRLYCYATGPFPEVATGPLAAFYNRMKDIPGIKKVLDGQSKFGTLAQYLVACPGVAVV